MNRLRMLRLVALCPLAAIGLGFADALLLAGVLAFTLLVVDSGLHALRKRSDSDQHVLIAALLAAIAAGSMDIVLHAVCHARAQVLEHYLPLTIVVALLFGRIDESSTWIDILRRSASRAVAFSLALLAGAALHTFLPAEARVAASLIASGLLLAIAAKFAPTDEAAPPERRPRARVTGPLR